MKKVYANIFEFNDFRKFLAAYQKARHAEDKSFSGSYICRQLGLPNTRSYFKDVINGKEVSKTFMERFIRLLDFSKEEAQFFRVLVQFNQTENVDEREYFFEQLISLNKTPKKLLDPKTFVFYKEWYHSAIRAILDIYNFKDDYAALARKVYPPIAPKQARESVALLKSLKLIKKDKQGFFKPTENSISTGEAVRDDLVKQYQLKCLELVKKALVSSNSGPKNMSTNTISISEEGFQRLAKRINKFKAEIRSLVHKDSNPAERVYQLSINLYPQSK